MVAQWPDVLIDHDVKIESSFPDEIDGIVDFLVTIKGFESVPREQLEWLARESVILTFAAGTVFKERERFEYFLILLEGGMNFHVIQNNQKKVMATWGVGAYDLGLLPFSRMKTSPGYTEVIGHTRTLALHQSKHRELVAKNYELTEVLVHSLSDRVRMFTTLHFQNEKLMALGKLSAGLAHELNNPAAAIGRSAEDLQQTISDVQTQFQVIVSSGLEVSELNALSSVVDNIQRLAVVRLPMLKRKQFEDEVRSWLEDNNILEDCSDALVDFGFAEGDLNDLKKTFSKRTLPPLLSWIGNSLQARKAAQEIAISSKRISELVQSVKSYTRMDQAPDMQEICINDGIRNTLTMIDHKIRRNNVNLQDDLAVGLPTIIGFPGELNQVWTNIIDNALDAMKNGGALEVKTFSDSENVFFSVTDNGSGIPPENLDRIFDPFFTTKDVGEGTGVGLDIVQKVVQQHHGEIGVNSSPGHTEFKVSFPIVIKHE